jgi:coenzyme F420-0:L-glutamate ligase/coenzyme F420-1:gamma-L-glutamate ligase
MFQPGQKLSQILLETMEPTGINIEDGDVLVIAQKIVSKVEGRLVNLNDVIPSARAFELAQVTGKDPRFVELVLSESSEVLRTRFNTLIVEHRLGFVCANAGIDHSNVCGPYGNPDDWTLLLPIDPDASAAQIRQEIQTATRKNIGILIIDSHGRAWRMGVVGAAIGVSGLPALVDKRGDPDLFGYQLRVTTIAVADELAAAASLVMGQADEGQPVVHVRGFPYPLREGSLRELIRPRDLDLFR